MESSSNETEEIMYDYVITLMKLKVKNVIFLMKNF